MKESTKELLEDAIVTKLTELNNMSSTEKENNKEYDVVNDLFKTLIENDKVELDAAERRDKREAEAIEAKEARLNEETFKKQQAKDQKIDRYIGYGINAASIVLPLVFYGTWMKRGFEFEKEGTFTSTTFRGLFGQFKPRR